AARSRSGSATAKRRRCGGGFGIRSRATSSSIRCSATASARPRGPRQWSRRTTQPGRGCSERAYPARRMAYELKLPDLGEGLTEGEIARWLVSEGQEVAEDDPLVEIQTDKTTVEIPSPAAGKVTQILVQEGKVVPVGTVLVVIGGDGAPAAEPAPSSKPEGRAA